MLLHLIIPPLNNFLLRNRAQDAMFKKSKTLVTWGEGDQDPCPFFSNKLSVSQGPKIGPSIPKGGIELDPNMTGISAPI